MSSRFQDDLESGSFSADYGHIPANVAVVSDGTLGGTKVVNLTSGNSAVLGIGQFNAEFGWGTIPLVSSGREFSVSACYDNSATPWNEIAGPFVNMFSLGRNPPDSVMGSGIPPLAYQTIFDLAQIATGPTTADLRLFMTTGGTSGGSLVGTAVNAISTNAPVTVKAVGLMSTITGGDASGGGTAAADGYLNVYVNGALVINWENKKVGLQIGNNPANHALWFTYANVSDPFHYFRIAVTGRLKNICIRDDSTGDCGFTCEAVLDEPRPTTPDTHIPTYKALGCCDTGGGSVGSTPDLDNTMVLSPWVPSCFGGGLVPSAADLVNSELWDPQ